jgi:hypothetical protein
VRADIATSAGTGQAGNEDFAAAVPGALVLLDGAYAPPGLATGCIHPVSWYARTLGGLLAGLVQDPARGLADALATAITATCDLHRRTCDLSHPCSPSATVALARIRGGELEYLVLGDSVLAAAIAGADPLIVTDDRLAAVTGRFRDAAPGAGPDAGQLALVRRLAGWRNRPGGFWVASTSPAAAAEAVTAVVPLAGLRGVALLSDGASRIADAYHLLTWPQVLAVVADEGPAALIARTRAAEDSDPGAVRWPRAKPSDDATVAWWPRPA